MDAAKLLFHIQEMERQMADTRLRIEGLEQPSRHDLDYRRLGEKMRGLERRAEELRSQAREKEQQLQDLEMKLKATRRRLYSLEIKTPHQAEKLKTQMEYLERQHAEIEAEWMAMEEGMERAEKEMEELRGDYADLGGLVAEERLLRQEQKKMLEDYLTKLKREYDKMWALVPRRLQVVYSRKKEAIGSAVAQVEEDACTGCSMGLSTAKIQAVKEAEEDVICCEGCDRILYYNHDG